MTEPDRFVRRNYGKGHGYKLGDRKVPGVTRILQAGVPKPGLIGWASSTVAEYVVDRLTLVQGRNGPPHVVADDLIRDIRASAKFPIPDGLPRIKLAKELAWAPNRERDTGGAKGTRVHDIAQALAETGEWTPAPDDEHVEGYADAIVDWWQRWEPTGVLVERPVLHRSAFYAGTFDLVAEINAPATVAADRVRAIVDYKAGRSGIFGETSLQVAAYRHAEIYVDAAGDERPMPAVDVALGVWLRPDGTHETYELDAGLNAFRLFRYAYELAKFLEGPDLFGLEGDPPVRQALSEPLFPHAQKAAS
jgi:hypothetical protein